MSILVAYLGSGMTIPVPPGAIPTLFKAELEEQGEKVLGFCMALDSGSVPPLRTMPNPNVLKWEERNSRYIETDSHGG